MKLSNSDNYVEKKKSVNREMMILTDEVGRGNEEAHACK
jgi:negative regulator of replication initiation